MTNPVRVPRTERSEISTDIRPAHLLAGVLCDRPSLSLPETGLYSRMRGSEVLQGERFSWGTFVYEAQGLRFVVVSLALLEPFFASLPFNPLRLRPAFSPSSSYTLPLTFLPLFLLAPFPYCVYPYSPTPRPTYGQYPWSIC